MENAMFNKTKRFLPASEPAELRMQVCCARPATVKSGWCSEALCTSVYSCLCMWGMAQPSNIFYFQLFLPLILGTEVS